MLSQAALWSAFGGARPQAILFDLDGTLVDSVADLCAALNDSLVQLQLAQVSEFQVRSWVGQGSQVLVQRGLAHNLHCSVDALDPQQLQLAHRQFLAHYQHHNGTATSLYPGVLAALNYWQSQTVPMAIVTNKPLQFVPALLSRLAIADYFQLLVGGDTAAEPKPSPQPLYYACQQLGVDCRQSLMIGDSRHDVQAAQAANMKVVAVSYGYNHGEPIATFKPDYLVDDLSHLRLDAPR